MFCGAIRLINAENRFYLALSSVCHEKSDTKSKIFIFFHMIVGSQLSCFDMKDLFNGLPRNKKCINKIHAARSPPQLFLNSG